MRHSKFGYSCMIWKGMNGRDEDCIPEQVLGIYALDLTEFSHQGAELDRGGALGAGHLGTGQLCLLTPS